MLLNILSSVAEVITEVATGLFSSDSNNNLEESKTYQYWMNLDYSGQKYYFESNEYLKDYMDKEFYENDRHLTAKHVAEIANKLNREFTNINCRY